MSDIVRAPRTPQESAERLTNSLDSNTAALDRIRNRYRLTLALIVVIALAFVVEFKFNYDGNVSQCRNDNAVIEKIDEKWQTVSEFLETLGVGGGPGEVALLALLADDIEKRDCSEINWLGR